MYGSAEGNLIREALINKLSKKRRVGRLRQWWMDRAKDDLKLLRGGTNIEDVEDRERTKKKLFSTSRCTVIQRGTWKLKHSTTVYLIYFIFVFLYFWTYL